MIQQRSGKVDECQWILQPNASLSRRQAKMLIGVLGMIMAMMGVGFALVGAWLVLPFSGAELWLLAYGLSCSMRQSGVREIITIDSAKIRIERVVTGVKYGHEFYRLWARVDWSRPKRLNKPGRLYLGSHGRRVEVGAFLVEEEKLALVQSLRQALSSEPTNLS